MLCILRIKQRGTGQDSPLPPIGDEPVGFVSHCETGQRQFNYIKSEERCKHLFARCTIITTYAGRRYIFSYKRAMLMFDLLL